MDKDWQKSKGTLNVCQHCWMKVLLIAMTAVFCIRTEMALGAESYNYVLQWGTAGTGNGQFNFPAGVAVDSTGNVYVADMANNRIQKFDSNGTYLTQFGSTFFSATCYFSTGVPFCGSGSGNGQFDLPNGVAVDSSGNAYIADMGNNLIEKFNSGDTYLTQWGGSGSGNGQFNRQPWNPYCGALFNYAWGVAVDSTGNVYVADFGNSRIQKFDSNGTYLTQWGTYGISNGQFAYPEGVAVDSTGNVYVADWDNNRIQKFDSNGTYLTQWGTYGTSNGQFAYPEGVAVDSTGNVYVADWGNNRIQKFDSNGTYLTQWGISGTGNGQFYLPTGVAVDSSGNVYVTDWGNNRVQKFSPVSEITSCSTSPTQQIVFNYTGEPQTWIVPSDVSSIIVDMAGASGGDGTLGSWANGNSSSGSPGLGARVQTTLSVLPGSTLNIYVGGIGPIANLCNGVPGGWNGGAGTTGWCCAATGGGGGGATDIRIGGTELSNRIVVAGGGGGAGGTATGFCNGNASGGNGGNAGQNGNNGTNASHGDAGGGGATGSSGYSLGDGSPGAENCSCGGSGGGGGGGYYGGFGGVSGVADGGGGGGAGSSYSIGTGTTYTTGYQSGNGYVTITYVSSQINGVCGSSNGQTLTTAPTSNLCCSGAPNTVSTTQSGWSWTCDGFNGGTTASCSASAVAIPNFIWLQANKNGLVNFDASYTYCPSSVGSCTYSWTFGDGTTDNSNSIKLSHSYPSTVGSTTYTATLTVSNANGSPSTSRTITVNVSPTVSSTISVSGMTVTLTDSSTSGASITINWGDGSTQSTGSAGSTFTHTYSVGNTYTIVETATVQGISAVSDTHVSVPIKYIVSGIVTDQAGTPLQGVELALILNNGVTKGIATTDINGNYTFIRVVPGIYTVTAVKTGYTFANPAASNVQVNSGPVTGVNISSTN
jgi:hypothetical protein